MIQRRINVIRNAKEIKKRGHNDDLHDSKAVPIYSFSILDKLQTIITSALEISIFWLFVLLWLFRQLLIGIWLQI